MKRKVQERAVAAGAKTEADFALFAALARVREQVHKLLDKTEDWRGTFLCYDFVLQRGRFYQPQRRPKGYRLRRANECYDNSFKLAFFGDDLTYCEGSVLLSLSEDRAADLEHGWCVTADGKVIDVTLREPALSYFGVPFTREEMAASTSLPITEEVVTAQLKEGRLP